MARRLMIEGLVQGVGYRAWFSAEAGALGLFGWVRNRQDGRVEALIKGDAAALEGMMRKAEQGPPLARVDSITISEAEGIVPHRFEIKPTV